MKQFTDTSEDFTQYNCMSVLVDNQDKFDRFKRWTEQTYVMGFDTETSIARLAKDRVLHLVQLGDYNEQWIFNWHRIPVEWQDYLKEIFTSLRWVKIAHNLQFDAGMLYVNGIYLQGGYDTQTTERVLMNGMSDDFYPSLLELVFQYTFKLLVKDEQTTFGDPDMVLTDEQIRYAGEDVKYLLPVYRAQLLRLHAENLEYVASLENDAACAYTEMSEEGVHLDVPYWLSLQDKALPIVEDAKRRTDAWLQHKDFVNHTAHLTAQEDIMELPMNYPKGLLQLMQKIWPELTGTSKAVIGKFLSVHNRSLPQDEAMALQAMAAGDKSMLEQLLIERFKEDLIQQGYITPKGTILINWNSPDQALKVAKLVAPKLQGLSEKELRKVSHPFFLDLQGYRESLKLISTYGEQFIHKHLHNDGKIHTTYNQIVSTGRVSSRAPNMQNIPAKESVGNLYRNAFIPPKGWVIVDSDYASQELVVIAYISNDPTWNDALRKGEDLHSICADLVFKKKWKDAAESGCLYYQKKQKCKCKGHKRLRDNIKTINFGLAYGMTEFELSSRLAIPLSDARNLMGEYFRTFPRIKGTLDYLGRFGVENGYIITIAPFFRKRWFPYWRENRGQVEAHLAGVVMNHTLGEIMRASMNTPIQGSSADMVKTSSVLIRNYLIDNRLTDSIKPILQVHDQNTTVCKAELADFWKPKFTELMEEAARLIIPNGLLKAETNVTEKWSK